MDAFASCRIGGRKRVPSNAGVCCNARFVWPRERASELMGSSRRGRRKMCCSICCRWAVVRWVRVHCHCQLVESASQFANEYGSHFPLREGKYETLTGFYRKLHNFFSIFFSLWTVAPPKNSTEYISTRQTSCDPYCTAVRLVRT